MRIEIRLCHRPDRLGDGRSEADVRHEMTVHNIQVQKIRAAPQHIIDTPRPGAQNWRREWTRLSAVESYQRGCWSWSGDCSDFGGEGQRASHQRWHGLPARGVAARRDYRSSHELEARATMRKIGTMATGGEGVMGVWIFGRFLFDVSLPPRPREGHKGLFGRVLIVGGNRDMIGAPVLAGTAALRCGAGLVQLAVPRAISDGVFVDYAGADRAGIGQGRPKRRRCWRRRRRPMRSCWDRAWVRAPRPSAG